MSDTRVRRTTVLNAGDDVSPLRRALVDLNLTVRGMADDGLLLIRRFDDPAPGSLRHQPQRWAEAAEHALARIYASAVRPALTEPTPPDDDAVVFENELERFVTSLWIAATKPRPRWWHTGAGCCGQSLESTIVNELALIPWAVQELDATGRFEQVIGTLDGAAISRIDTHVRHRFGLPPAESRHVGLPDTRTVPTAEPSDAQRHVSPGGDGGLDDLPPHRSVTHRTTTAAGEPAPEQRIGAANGASRTLIELLTELAGSRPTHAHSQPGPFGDGRHALGRRPTQSGEGESIEPWWSSLQRRGLRVETRFAGTFMIVNALIVLGVYGDFTDPARRQTPTDPFRLMLACAHALCADRLAPDDPILLLVDALASRAPEPNDRTDTDDAPHIEAVTNWIDERFGTTLKPYQVVELAGVVTASPGRIDVSIDIDDLPIEVRLAGIDRDPGWVPACGHTLRFHFEHLHGSEWADRL